MIHTTVYNTAQVLHKKGISRVVLSPGSRNAPLTISFARHPEMEIFNIIDERSAGFIALGMAQKLKEPVVLCCTSGTAVLNYAPAIAEAHYQQIPLLVISADRPSEWQGQRDGQTIRQPNSLQNFVKGTFELPADLQVKDAQWDYLNRLNEAVNLATSTPQGPVHINIPFREPFYPAVDDHLVYDDQVKVIEPIILDSSADYTPLIQEWHTYSKRLIVAGQNSFDIKANYNLAAISDEVVIIADIISNIDTPDAIRHHDLFLTNLNETIRDSLRPDLLVTFGQSVIAKNLKTFLRQNPPKAHWHFDEAMIQADTFQSMTRLIRADATPFFAGITRHGEEKDEFKQQIRKNFYQSWSVSDQKTRRRLNEAIVQADFCEFKAFAKVLEMLPPEIDIHLANSMPVRYANFIQGLKESTEVFCNRGTSGIDGTNGTAVGAALVADRPTVLLTGDLSFFYDRNAFFHQYDLSRLKIVVFNNQGGGIFRLINGPAGLPELSRHFETRHQHSARYAALEFGLDYYKADDETSLEHSLARLLAEHNTPKLLEVFTDPENNQRMFHWIKNKINE